MLAIGLLLILRPREPATVLIDADRALARTVHERGEQAAMYRVLAPDAIVNVARLAAAKPQAKPPKGDELSWDVAEVEISGAGDLGYTYGPWVQRSGDQYKTGHFFRVWHRYGRDWKVDVDVEVPSDEIDVPSGQVKIVKRGAVTKLYSMAEATAALTTAKIAAETAAVNGLLLPDALILRGSSLAGVPWPPFDRPDQASSIADSADLACDRGTADLDGSEVAFARVWRRTADGSWKIAVDYIDTVYKKP